MKSEKLFREINKTMREKSQEDRYWLYKAIYGKEPVIYGAEPPRTEFEFKFIGDNIEDLEFRLIADGEEICFIPKGSFKIIYNVKEKIVIKNFKTYVKEISKPIVYFKDDRVRVAFEKFYREFFKDSQEKGIINYIDSSFRIAKKNLYKRNKLVKLEEITVKDALRKKIPSLLVEFYDATLKPSVKSASPSNPTMYENTNTHLQRM